MEKISVIEIEPRKLDQLVALQERIVLHTSHNDIRTSIFADVVELMDADFAASFIWNPISMTSEYGISHNIPKQKMYEYNQSLHSLDPHTKKMRSFGRAVLADEAMPYEELHHTQFYNDFLHPIGMASGLNIFLFDVTIDIGDFRLWRSADSPPYTISDRILLDCLALPIKRALLRQRAAFQGLTARECDVALLVARGCRDQDIARILRISLSTVRTHLNHAMEKRGCSNRAELAVSVTHRTL